MVFDIGIVHVSIPTATINFIDQTVIFAIFHSTVYGIILFLIVSIVLLLAMATSLLAAIEILVEILILIID
jgi:hypothetical protein